MGESLRLRETKGFPPEGRILETGGATRRHQERQATVWLHRAGEAEGAQVCLERGGIHAVVTPARTLSEPERKPRRSMATRAKPAVATA